MLELLSPAGGVESLKAGINNGANAVYLGLKKFSARAMSENFDKDEFSYYANYAKLFGVKLYATVNTLVKNKEISSFLDCIEDALIAGADAFIVQDMFLGERIKKEFPDITLHLSTQAGVCNVLGAELAKEYGFSRVVLARETPIEDIKEISKIIETEAFVQGALCSSFSGHCYMSSFIGGNSGNRGLCKQPCRKKYSYYNDGKIVTDGYVLSLADLSVGKKIQEYIDAGVSSFKIEGRMRRPEYVAAATAYFRGILDNNSNKIAFSDLKRTFNRNNYTNGLAFGQEKNFISSEVQGHIGERIGSINKINGKSAIVFGYKGENGNAYKILRNGKEVGSAIFRENNNSAVLSYNGNILVGDDVHVTTDSAVNKRLLAVEKKLPVEVNAKFLLNKPAEFLIKTPKKQFTYIDDEILTSALNQPLTDNDVKICFEKVGEYPYAVEVVSKVENVFVSKGKLNALRRNIYSIIFNSEKVENIRRIKNKNVEIISDRNATENACIYKGILPFNGLNIVFPENYNSVIGKSGEYLYLPPYANGNDLRILETAIETFDGVYADGYYGIKFAEKYNKNLIVGAEINVFNFEDVASLLKRGISIDNIVLSKELSSSELDEFPKSCKRLVLGNIPLMHLIYCPISKQCEKCKFNGNITLKDDENRVFKVKKYKMSSCRFVIYNAYDLIPKVNVEGAKLYDFSAMDEKTAEVFIENDKKYDFLRSVYKFTNGNLPKGIN